MSATVLTRLLDWIVMEVQADAIKKYEENISRVVA